jgi:alpha-glucosidase
VADQADEPDSVLSFTRRAIARRSANEELATGSYRSLASPPATWVFTRGRTTTVALNMSDDAAELPLSGTISLSTRLDLEGTTLGGSVELAPWSGVVVELS